MNASSITFREKLINFRELFISFLLLLLYIFIYSFYRVLSIELAHKRPKVISKFMQLSHPFTQRDYFFNKSFNINALINIWSLQSVSVIALAPRIIERVFLSVIEVSQRYTRATVFDFFLSFIFFYIQAHSRLISICSLEREQGVDISFNTRDRVPIGAYTRPLSIYHSEIVGRRSAVAACPFLWDWTSWQDGKHDAIMRYPLLRRRNAGF